MLSTYNHFRVKYELMLIEKNEWKIDCRYIFNKLIKITYKCINLQCVEILYVTFS